MTTREKQIEIEEEMVHKTKARYHAAYVRSVKRGEAADTNVGQSFTAHCITTVAKRLQEYLGEARKGKPGKGSAVSSKLRSLDLEKVAFLGCRGAFHALINQDKYTYACTQVGTMIEEEAWLAAFELYDKKRLDNGLKGLRRRGITTKKNRKENLKRAAKAADFVWKPWSQRERVCVGDLILEIFKEEGFYTLIRTRRDKGRKGYIWSIQPTEKLNDWINEGKIKGELLRPFRLPLVIEPKRRHGKYLTGSGYYSPFIREFAVIKRARENHRTGLLKSDLTKVGEALRILDNTPRKVNAPVLAVLKAVWARGIPVNDLPSRDLLEVPKKPRGIDKMKKDNPKLIAYRAAAKVVHEANHRSISKKLMVERVIEVAERFKDEPAIFFPHDIDFRGRVYDAPTGLNPQGPDFSRGLLMFAYGKPVKTREAMRWLMIHGANTWGNDKVSFDERVQWVEENVDRIRNVVSDPLADYWWTEADKPFGFLAWCFDYIGVIDDGRDSYIPVAMDGSCNGLQHLSAMLLDPVGGKAVNLLPSEKPNDIYQEVADRVTKKLLAMPGHWVAETWLSFGINRKMTKRATMVMPYGGTMMATLNYVEEAYREKLGNNPSPFGEQERQACAFLAKLVHKAIRDVVIKADEAMLWLQTCAGVFAKANQPLYWTTPTGMVCCQEYMKQELVVINTILNGRIRKPVALRKQLHVYSDKEELDPKKMRSSFSPNFVHSMDASALIFTVIEAAKQNIDDLEMVHDSYGTHAADTELLAEILRDQFVAMYRNGDVLSKLREEMIEQLEPEFALLIPEVPQCDSLDIEEVRHSDFFFA